MQNKFKFGKKPKIQMRVQYMGKWQLRTSFLKKYNSEYQTQEVLLTRGKNWQKKVIIQFIKLQTPTATNMGSSGTRIQNTCPSTQNLSAAAKTHVQSPNLASLKLNPTQKLAILQDQMP